MGQWESTAKLRGVNTRLRFFFENNGELRVQAMADGKETVTQGKWATRDGLMKMDITDGARTCPICSPSRPSRCPTLAHA